MFVRSTEGHKNSHKNTFIELECTTLFFVESTMKGLYNTHEPAAWARPGDEHASRPFHASLATR